MMNKKSFALILSFMVIILLTILVSAIIFRRISESNISQKYVESNQAFWLAEAGIAQAVRQLPVTGTVNGTMTVASRQGSYTAAITLLAGYSARYEIISTGSLGNIQRRIKVIVELPAGPSPDLLTVAVETTGGLNITGSVDINPAGSVETSSTLSFGTVFGTTKEAIKATANNLYTDPPTNQQPVDGVTWVDLTGDTVATATKYTISSNWSGSGLLIIDGNRNETTKDIPAVEISGNWNFNGMIWVIGKIKISGTPAITGAIFAESSVDVDSTLTGNATINFNSGDVEDAFDLLNPLFLANILSWQEI